MPHPPANDATSSVPVRARSTLREDAEPRIELLTACANRGEATVEDTVCSLCPRETGLCYDAEKRSRYRVCFRDPRAAAPRPDALAAVIAGRDVLCLAQDVGVEVVASLFLERGIEAAPVVDDESRPLGLVSRTDLLRHYHDEGVRDEPTPAREKRALSSLGLRRGYHAERALVATAADVMTPLVFALPEDAPIGRAAALMAAEGVSQLVVLTQEGRVAGVFTGIDLARWAAQREAK